jgi:hypothetical protein
MRFRQYIRLIKFVTSGYGTRLEILDVIPSFRDSRAIRQISEGPPSRKWQSDKYDAYLASSIAVGMILFMVATLSNR